MTALYFYRYPVYERKKRTINIFKNSPADCSLCTCYTGSGISFMEICSICPRNLYSCSSYPYCPIPYIPYCQKNPDCHKIRERKMNAARRLFSSVFILFFLTAAQLFAQDSISPIIIEKENLPVILQFKSRDDAFFKEHQKIVEDNNKVIEFDGDYWHGEKRGNQKRDAEREANLRRLGYTDILRIRERDYNADPDAVVRRCVEFITGSCS